MEKFYMYPQENKKKTLKFMKVINKYIYLIFSLHKAYYLHDQKMADEVQTQ